MHLSAESSVLVSPPARILLNEVLVTVNEPEGQGLHTILCNVHRTYVNNNR